jgi:putative hydrolase of HD superfamily
LNASDPASIVQRQLDAYNAHDIDALMATYSADVEHYEFPSTLVATGANEVRARLSVRLQEPDLHARLLARTVMGELVIDHEVITRNFPEGIGSIEMIAMYEVRGGRISRGWFKFGEKRIGVAT